MITGVAKRMVLLISAGWFFVIVILFIEAAHCTGHRLLE